MKSNYRSPLFRRLRDELIERVPRDERLAQTARAEDLLAELQPSQTHPYEFYHWRITNTQPDLAPKTHISVPDAQHDLCQLVEDLSDSVDVPAESAAERVLTVEELAKTLNVSPKTISRWRQHGLAGRRFLFEGRKRLGFLRSSVDRFIHKNERRVRRGAEFHHLTAQERQEIVELARGLAASGKTPADVVHAICNQTGRGGATVRTTIRSHDQEHPAEAIFPRGPRPLGNRLGEEIFSRYRRGESLDSLAHRYGRTRSSVSRIIRKTRAQRVLALRLDYMPNPEFDRPESASEILAPTPPYDGEPRRARRPSGIPAYLASLYEVPLLTAKQERHLFRKLNYLKYQASRMREQLDPQRPDRRLLDEIETFYSEAIAVGNELVRANLRLVVSIVKAYASRQEQFFDLVSDGNMSLIRAVEKFDYSRGNKFSTYATWAIRKNFARSFALEMRRHGRFRTSQEELLSSKTEHRPNPREQEDAQRHHERTVGRLLGCLDDRERRIIANRFGLDWNKEPQTLQEVGDQFGVSKERIRQIEARAMSKLRQAACQDDIDLPAA